MDSWTREVDLPASAPSVSEARDFVTSVLLDVGLVDVVDDARLVISELASNAVVHARTPLTVVAEYHGADLRLCILDESDLLPRRSGADPAAESGRGLLLVEVLSTAWGVDVGRRGGKSVWARLPLGSRAGVGGPLRG